MTVASSTSTSSLTLASNRSGAITLVSLLPCGADVEHTFLTQLAQGTLPLPAFRHYLVQDYHFLTHFSRSTALGAFKSTSLDVISAAAKVMMHIKTEVQLHKRLCSEYGVPDEEMEHGQEDLACVAYTRWVTDVGAREDWFGLQVA